MRTNLLFTFLALLISTLAYTQTKLEIVNPGFEDPDDDIKYKTLSTGKIIGWMTDDTTNDRTGREAGTFLDNTGKYWCYMNALAGEIYQSDIDVIPATATKYIVIMNVRYGWDGGAGDLVTSKVYLDAYSDYDPTSRVQFDSVEYAWKAMGTAVFTDTFSIPAGSPQAGKKLCLGYAIRNVAKPANGGSDWGSIDSVSMYRIDGPVSINNMNSSATIHVSPNPSSDGLIKLQNVPEGKSVTYEIFDINGRTILKGILNNNTIDLGGKSNGLYLLRLNVNNNTAIQKIILK